MHIQKGIVWEDDAFRFLPVNSIPFSCISCIINLHQMSLFTPISTVLAIIFFVSSSSGMNRPNILFVFTDDHGPHAIGAYAKSSNNDWLKSVKITPVIDKLAEEGLLFVNSFCTNSICGPSRAVIQTGKHSHRNGFMNNGNTFDWDQQTFPKLLQEAGYQTALYGKSHLKGTPQGFNDWAVLPGQGMYYNPDMIFSEGKQRINGYCTDVVTNLAVDWLHNKRSNEKPFMLMVQHKAPHRNWMPALRHLELYDDVDIPEPPTLFDECIDNTPGARLQELEINRHMDLNYDLFVDLTPDFNQPPSQKSQDRSAWRNMQSMPAQQIKAWRDYYEPRDKAFHDANLKGKELVRWKFQRYAKNYLRCIKSVDESLLCLQEELIKLNLDKNTIVIYSSDQGFFIGDHGWYDKRWMYEESLKMPLIVKWPGVTKPGSKTKELVQNLDYAQTFLEIAQAPIPKDMQGKSLVPLLKGKTPVDWRNEIYYHYYEYPSVHMVPRHYGIRTRRYKLMHFYQFGDEWELYDLKVDPDEINNVYDSKNFSRVQDLLKKRLTKLRLQYQDESDVSIRPDYIEKYRTGS